MTATTSHPHSTDSHPPPAALTEAVLAAAGTGERARRAKSEPMTLRPQRDGRIIVETDGGTYVVDSDHASCTCPDYAIRGARCKHRRRVAIEAAAGRIPPAGMRTGVCAVCGDPQHIAVGQPTSLCQRHSFEPGELVVDRETGSCLIVLNQTTERADSRRTDDGRLIAGVETNCHYGDHEPVIEAVYASARRPAKRYAFPASRLSHTDRDPAHGRRLLGSAAAMAEAST